MRITVTILGMCECPKCGKKFRGVISKTELVEKAYGLKVISTFPPFFKN